MILNAFHTIKASNIDSTKNCVFSICSVESGGCGQGFPDCVTLKGTMRLYDDDLKAKMVERITNVAKSVASAHKCEAVVNINDGYPAVINHLEQTNHIIRLSKKYLGEANFS